MTFSFNIPLSVFHYKGYEPDFFTSWYNTLKETFEEMSGICREKRVLNIALSVLILPYIASFSLGLVIYNKSKTSVNKVQVTQKKNEIRENKVSESLTKRFLYSIFAIVATTTLSVVLLFVLIVPATLALATFYFLNRKLSKSVIATFKVGSGRLYKNKHKNITVSFYKIDSCDLDIRWNIEIKFPSQFEQILEDLCQNMNSDMMYLVKDTEHNAILKLSVNIYLKNGLKLLYSEISNMIEVSIQGFVEVIEKLMRLDREDITYDQLRDSLDELRIKIVNTIDSRLTNHLVQDAYRVAFIQAIKIAQQRRRKDSSLEERLKEVLVEQDLKGQGKELPTEKEMIKKDLGIFSNMDDRTFHVFKAKRRELITQRKIDEKKLIDVYKNIYHQETMEALYKAEMIIKKLKTAGEERYNRIFKKLEEIIYQNRKNGSLKVGDLKKRLENLFRFEPNDQRVYRELIKSRIRKAKVVLNQSCLAIDIKQNLLSRFYNLNLDVCSHHEINLLLEKMHSKIIECKTENLFKEQEKILKDIENNTGMLMLFNKERERYLIKKMISYRRDIKNYLTQPIRIREVIEEQNRNLEIKKNDEESESTALELVELCLKNNQEILKALCDLESEKKRSLINEKTESDYKEELISREKIKFAVIEDKLLELWKKIYGDEGQLKIIEQQEIVKRLLERAELEYCLAEKCVKYPVIKMKNDIKYFFQALLSALINRLVNLIISNVPKNNEYVVSKFWNSLKASWGYIWMGLSATVVNKDSNVEGKALDIAHDTCKEIEILLQYFESSYKEVCHLISDVFTDGGDTFKSDVWPKIRDHLYEMWNRFSQDIEFTLVNNSSSKNISKKLNEVSITEQQADQLLATI